MRSGRQCKLTPFFTVPSISCLLCRLRDAQGAAMDEPDRSAARLLLDDMALRLQADLRWLEAWERKWKGRKSES